MTKRKFVKVLLAVMLGMLVSCGCILAVGCNDNTDNTDPTEPTEYTVTFDLNYDGAPAATTKTTENGKVAKPTPDPVRDEYDFDDWYTAAEGGDEYDFNTVLTADTTLYAHWTEEDPPVVTNPVIKVGDISRFVSAQGVLESELVAHADLTAGSAVTVDVADGVSGRYTVAVAPVEVVEYIFSSSQVEIPCENLVITVTVGNSEIELSWENLWGVVEDQSAEADFTGVKSITVSASADVSVVMILWEDVSEPETEEIDVIVHVGEETEVIKVVKGEKLTINQILEVVNKDGGKYTAEDVKVYTDDQKSAEYNFDEEVQNTLELYVEILENEEPTPPDEEESTPLTGKIYIVGDSTVCAFNDKYYLPRYGYGTQLYNYLNLESANQIVNLALSGRSSLSFLSEANYTTLVNSIGEGDYLIIGFGHNDEKSDDAERFTSPVGDKDTAGSFQYTLYQNYVKLAEGKGATAILCTPIVRYATDGVYDGSEVHNTSDGDYAAAIKALGAATGTTVIDLTSLTKAVYEVDNAAAAYFHAHTTYVLDADGEKIPDGMDKTHINMYGAKMVAYLFANALKSTDCGLKNHVNANIAAPTFEVDYQAAINADYVKPNYTPFDPSANAANSLGNGWYKTAMGALGGDSVSPFEISYSNGVFTVGNETGNKGKIESSSDGFAAAFMQIEATKNFTASATVTVKSHTASNTQAAFGMMLRDDILVNQRDDTLASNYVAAGALSKPGVVFSRESGTLSSVKNSMNAFVVGESYEVSIVRVGQVVTVKFGTVEATYTDFDFVARDNNYMYLCLFATRSTVVEFTNVQVEITGDAQGA